jgi:3-phenylpropionate/cinnamic acid dioxygenase small subunit
MTDQTRALAIGTEVLEREAIFLDERRWDEWLGLFAEDCQYWVPMWRADETLTADPQRELSHIFYASRAGLEDRIVRIRSGRSVASTPLPRTTHVLANIRLRDTPDVAAIRVRSSWVTHVFFTSSNTDHAFHGHSEHDLVLRGERWLIARKKIVLQNDYIPTMLDMYCL